MKKGLFKITLLFLAFNSLIVSGVYAQDFNSRWVVGLGFSAVDYFPTLTPKHYPGLDPSTGNQDGFFNEITNAQDHWNIYAPSINATRFFSKMFALDIQISANKISKLGDLRVDETSYFAFDGNLLLHFANPENVFVPYVYAGGGYTFADKSGGTVNFGVGGKYWFNETFGFCAQGGYKYNSPDFSLVPHLFYTFSIVMKLNPHRRFMWNSRSRKRFNWRNGI